MLYGVPLLFCLWSHPHMDTLTSYPNTDANTTQIGSVMTAVLSRASASIGVEGFQRMGTHMTRERHTETRNKKRKTE